MINAEQPSATFRPAALLSGSPSPRTGHLPFASDLIAALKPSMIVELGVSYGDTYFGFCQMVAENDLGCACYGIDSWYGGKEFAAANNTIFDAVTRYNDAKYRAFSHLIRKGYDQTLSQFQDDSINVLSLDGTQPYEALKATFNAWLPKVTPAGVILLHDIGLRGGEAGAWRLWEELKPSYASFSFRNNDGLALLAKSRQEAGKIPFLAALFRAPRDQEERIRRYYFLCAERLEMAARLGATGSSDTGCSLFQVFRSEAGHYETTPELSHVLSPGAWVNLHLHLPNGVGDRPLRIDVANRPSVVDIATLCLRKADGQAVWTWNPNDPTDAPLTGGSGARMPAAGIYRVLSFGAASHLLLPDFRGASFDQPLDLEIRLRVDLELSAVREMNQKWADFEKAKSEWENHKPVNGDAAANPAALEAAVGKAKIESAKQLAQARVEAEQKIKQITADAEARLEALRADFDAELMRQASQLEEERRAHQATIADRDQMITQQPRMLQEISIAQGNVEELKAEIENISTEHAAMEFDLTELRKLNARLSAALEEERAVRATMQDSSSWQMTKPFRAVGDLFGPRKKY